MAQGGSSFRGKPKEVTPEEQKKKDDFKAKLEMAQGNRGKPNLKPKEVTPEEQKKKDDFKAKLEMAQGNRGKP